jgi:Concanavalin A-like lectin/glucanases superfamily
MSAKLRMILMCTFGSLVLPGAASAEPVVWHLDNLEWIAGHEVTVEGEPKVIETQNGKAIEFDGMNDGIFLDLHPLAGMSEFTVEVVFKPYSGGAPEQRFFHMQENGSENRVMFETRLVDNDRWFLDTFIKSGDQKLTLKSIEDTHELGSWYHAAIVVDGHSFRHFVNGEMESCEELRFTPQQAGRTSLGVRLNKINWFRGAIRTVRITPRALQPDEFLTAGD